jgi:hypothetical protein
MLLQGLVVGHSSMNPACSSSVSFSSSICKSAAVKPAVWVPPYWPLCVQIPVHRRQLAAVPRHVCCAESKAMLPLPYCCNKLLIHAWRRIRAYSKAEPFCSHPHRHLTGLSGSCRVQPPQQLLCLSGWTALRLLRCCRLLPCGGRCYGRCENRRVGLPRACAEPLQHLPM